jgi:hypothetical protein
MVSGGTRFTGSARPRPAARVIDVEANPHRETLYDVLVVTPAASSREIRKLARTMRRNLPEATALHDVCLAEQVLGQSELRSEYDALLARLTAAKQPIPKIGTAIEGSRLGPSIGERMGSAGRKSASAAGKVLKVILQIAVVIVAIAIFGVILGSMGGSRYNAPKYHVPEFKPIDIKPIDPKLFDLPPTTFAVPKLDTTLPKIDRPAYGPSPLPRYQTATPKLDIKPPPAR